ncbi:hypothetical protein PG984_014004 [Apiospora sp. TS-2023a]
MSSWFLGQFLYCVAASQRYQTVSVVGWRVTNCPRGCRCPAPAAFPFGAFRQKVSSVANNLGEIKRDASGSNGNGNGNGPRVGTSAVRQVESAHITKLGFLTSLR